jgi:hypothetical protein
MQTDSLILAKNPHTNENKSADYSAFENGLRCVEKPIPRQICQFIAHQNGFGCVQNQTYRKMQINLPILAPMKMVLDTSKTNL